jgi:hypothetical protein
LNDTIVESPFRRRADDSSAIAKAQRVFTLLIQGPRNADRSRLSGITLAYLTLRMAASRQAFWPCQRPVLAGSGGSRLNFPRSIGYDSDRPFWDGCVFFKRPVRSVIADVHMTDLGLSPT